MKLFFFLQRHKIETFVKNTSTFWPTERIQKLSLIVPRCSPTKMLCSICIVLFRYLLIYLKSVHQLIMLTEANVASRKEARISFCLLLALLGVLIWWTVVSWPVLFVTMTAGVTPCALLLLIWMCYFCLRSEDMRQISAIMSILVLFIAITTFGVIGKSGEFSVSISDVRSLINVLPWLNAAIMCTAGLITATILVFNRCCRCACCPYCHCCDQAHCCQAAEAEVLLLCSDPE